MQSQNYTPITVFIYMASHHSTLKIPSKPVFFSPEQWGRFSLYRMQWHMQSFALILSRHTACFNPILADKLFAALPYLLQCVVFSSFTAPLVAKYRVNFALCPRHVHTLCPLPILAYRGVVGEWQKCNLTAHFFCPPTKWSLKPHIL